VRADARALDRHAARLGQVQRVDHVDRARTEHVLQYARHDRRRDGPQRRVVRSRVADQHALGRTVRQRHRHPAQPLGQLQQRTQPPHLVAADRGRVHRPRQVAVHERGAHRAGDLERDVLLRLLRRRPQVRRQHHARQRAQGVVGRQRLRRVDVQPRAAETASAHGVRQRVFVEHAAARRVHHDGARLHPRQLGRADQPFRALREWDVQ
jgi:hypothetical protein